MNDTLISLETAKLAKEKGYDRIKIVSKNNTEAAYNAPTQSLLAKWLREVHNIFVSVSGHSKIWQFYIIAYHPELGVPVNLANFDSEFKKKYLDTFIAYESYESALEIGLYEALQLIK